MSKVKLSKEDKDIFTSKVKTLTPEEFLQAANELEYFKDRFTKADWKFITSNMGKRAYQFLKNVVYTHSFMGNNENNNKENLYE